MNWHAFLPSSNFQLHISWVILAGILPDFHGVLPDRFPGDFGGRIRQADKVDGA
jgi:hypothetical protein